VFCLEHPLGAVIGRARIGDGFFFAQGVTVGGNKGAYPVIGRHVSLLSNSKVVGASVLGGQAAQPLPERAVRRDIPITNAIRRAFEAGTRDSTGRPGRNYWQLRADYDIRARIDTATSRLTGRERITVHNHSLDSLSLIGLRLDANHFIGTVPRAAPWVPAENTDGMVITRLTVNGEEASLAAMPGGPVAQAAASRPSLTGAQSTVARVRLPRPVVRVLSQNHRPNLLQGAHIQCVIP
jgi:hypothetical protein